jgi:Flp pilus assembly protein TadD
LIDVGRFTDAVQPLTQAVQLDSTIPMFSNNLGIALERSGQLTAAAAAYRGALAADSGYARAKVSLARVEKALGAQ